MTITAEIKKLARQALTIKNSQVPLHRAIDILATSHGDIPRIMQQYKDINDADLRRAFHYCAQLLRAIEHEAGLTPPWEQTTQATPPASPADSPSPSPQTTTPPDNDLRPFIDESMRGKVRVAKAYTDGASKGNPGQSGIGVAIFTMDGKKIAQQARAIGIATNNIAEYTALIEAMQMARDLEIKVLNVISDSELMVRQVSGIYKIKNPDILKKVQEVNALRKNFDQFTINYVSRENNKLADALSTSLLKKKTTSKNKTKTPTPQTTTEQPYRDILGPIDPNADDGSTE